MSETGPTSIGDVRKQVLNGMDSIENAPVGAFQDAMERLGDVRRQIAEKADEIMGLTQQAVEIAAEAAAATMEMHAAHEAGRRAVAGATEGSNRDSATDLNQATAAGANHIEDMQEDLSGTLNEFMALENAADFISDHTGVVSAYEEATIGHSERYSQTVQTAIEKAEEFNNM